MAEFYRSLGKYRVFAKVKASLAAGRKYMVTGKVGENSVQIWIVEEGSRKRVSTIGAAKYVYCKPLAFVCEDGKFRW